MSSASDRRLPFPRFYAILMSEMREFVKISISAVLLVAVMLSGVPDAGAGSKVGGFDWADAGDLQDWYSGDPWSTLSNPGSGGTEGDGYLNIHMDATSELPPAEWFALAKVDAVNCFAGTWESSMWVEFNFWANDVEPGYVQVRWGGDSGETWRNTIFDSAESTMQTQTWTHLMSAQFESYEDWDYGGGSQQEFVDDLASIDWIGVYIWRDSTVAQDYGLDDFNLMVPEPAEWTMILVSVAATVLSMRKRRRCAALVDGIRLPL